MSNRLPQTFLKTIAVILVVVNLFVLVQVFPREFGISLLDRAGFSNLNTSAEELPDFPYEIYLPKTFKNYKFWIDVDRIWTVDLLEDERAAYLFGDTIHHYVSGSNFTGEIADADFTWTQKSPCGLTDVITGTLSLAPGSWAESYATSDLDCKGIYTHTLQVTHKGRVISQSKYFVANNPSTPVLSENPAFDICSVPTLYQMQRWWDESPYKAVNIYIGGIHRGCANKLLDPIWVHEVSQQGWELIPTWVGPQAPCSKFKYRIDSDPVHAYIQGRLEADAAFDAAKQLGLIGGNVIYYDLEGYAPASTECREATQEFLTGWVERLHEYGLRAGAYGGSCSSYMSDWAFINPMPDNVWIADWKWPYEFDPDASVYGVRCLDNPEILYWTNHERLRQYAGDHIETWGDVSLGIDSNIADGEVVVIPPDPTVVQDSIGESALQISSEKSLPITADMDSFQLLSPGTGWVLAAQRLLWTNDSGANWVDITPVEDNSEFLMAVYFADADHGWAVSQANGSLTVHRTENGGEAWQSHPLDWSGSGFGSVYLDFVDLLTGWMVVNLQSSANFSLGELYRTRDGGVTWEQLSIPLGAPVHFLDANQGLVVGGVDDEEVYKTVNGGETWELQNLDGMDYQRAGMPQPATNLNSVNFGSISNLPEGVQLVEFVDANTGWALLESGACTGEKGVAGSTSADPLRCDIQSALLQTRDGGQTWEEITPKFVE